MNVYLCRSTFQHVLHPRLMTGGGRATERMKKFAFKEFVGTLHGARGRNVKISQGGEGREKEFLGVFMRVI